MPEDIRVKFSFKSHPKRLRLATSLGSDGVLALLDLWLFAAENHRDGLLGENPNPEYIAAAAGWAGDAQEFWDVLTDLEWIVETDAGQWGLNDWPEHQPFVFTFEQRSETARKAANIGWIKRRNAESNAKRNAPTDLPTVPTDQPTPPANRVDAVDPQGVADLWNEVMKPSGHAGVRELGKTRRSHIRARSKRLDSLEAWGAYFQKLLQIPWATGQADSGWFATFDWAIRSSENVDRVSEEPTKRTTTPGHVSRPADATCILELCENPRHGQLQVCSAHYLAGETDADLP